MISNYNSNLNIPPEHFARRKISSISPEFRGRNTMKLHNLILLLIVSLLIFGCAKPIKDGEWKYTSKPINGTIQNDSQYLSLGETFRISLPHPPTLNHLNNREWEYARIRELNIDRPESKEEFFSIGPAALDNNIYSLTINSYYNDISFEQHVKKYISDIVPTKLVLIRGNHLINTFTKRSSYHGYPTIYLIHESKKQYLISRIVHSQSKIYVFDVLTSKAKPSPFMPDEAKKWMPNREMVYDQQWPFFEHMFNSIEILK